MICIVYKYYNGFRPKKYHTYEIVDYYTSFLLKFELFINTLHHMIKKHISYVYTYSGRYRLRFPVTFPKQ